MADWYVSSATYALVAAYSVGHVYSVGDFVKPTSPAANSKWVFRCTTGGTAGAEPSWSTTNNGTNTSGAVFTNVTGQSSFGWSAAAGDIGTIIGNSTRRTAASDNVYLSSDHTETAAASIIWGSNIVSATTFSNVKIISINRAGSVPPVAADIQSGAVLATPAAGNITLDAECNLYWSGITFSSGGVIFLNNSFLKSHYFKNCSLVLNNATSSSKISSNFDVRATFDNTTVTFGHAAQAIHILTYMVDIEWINTASPISGGTTPTALFVTDSSGGLLVTARGLDLSGYSGTLVSTATGSAGSKVLLDSCKINSGLTRLSASPTGTRDVVELINCYDGTNIINERYQAAGSVVIERTICLTSGATDDVGGFSLKMVTGTSVDKLVEPLQSFALDVELNAGLASSKTATVEIVSSGTLQTDEIALFLQYEGTAGSSLASFGDCSITTPLSAAGNVPSSAASWASDPATPVHQKLQVTFTPQQAGRARGVVKFGKASGTVYVNPQMSIA